MSNNPLSDISLDEILDGDIVEEYPVDESIDNSNAGDAVVYEVNGRYFQVITWNDRALDHRAGSVEVNEVEVDDEE
jgi:hypothetical protein